MAKQDWVRKFGERVEEAIDGLDGDSLADDIQEAVDWSELVKEIIKEDPDIKKRLKDKIVQLVGDKIDDLESPEDLTGSDDLREYLPDEGGIEALVSGLFKQGQPLREKLKEKIIKLVGEQIDGANDFEELTGDDEFRWFNNRPDDFSFSKIITELFESDKELKDKLKEKVQELTLENIDELDGNDMPEWEEFARMLEIEKRIREILAESDEIKEKLLEEIRNLINTKIEEGLDPDDLPEDFLKILDVSAEVSRVLTDREFRSQIGDQLQGNIRQFILQTVQRGDLGAELAEKVKTNPEFSALLERQVSEMMRNPELVAGIKATIKERLTNDPEVGRKIMGAVFEEAARGIVGKLFKSY